jgi:hypothetical protein
MRLLSHFAIDILIGLVVVSVIRLALQLVMLWLKVAWRIVTGAARVIEWACRAVEAGVEACERHRAAHRTAAAGRQEGAYLG